MFTILKQDQHTKVFQTALLHASDVVKRRWPNRYVGRPMLGFRECYRDLVEMGAIKDDAQETNLGRKHALIVWYLNRHEQQARTIRKIDRSAPFYQSGAWRKLRFSVLAERGGACQLCGAKGSDGARLHVDHIKPRSKFPDLSLDPTNMQVLCEDCNLGKADTVLA